MALSEFLAQLAGAEAVSLRAERDAFTAVASDYVDRAYFARHGRSRPG
ncbi:hypothetical protein [Cryptosporangium arvum]|nr:hypothetical protein [Cryptosporangium arvum]